MYLAAKLKKVSDPKKRVKKFSHGPEHPIGNLQYRERFGYDTEEYSRNILRPDAGGFAQTDNHAKSGKLGKFLAELNSGANSVESLYTTVPVYDEVTKKLKISKPAGAGSEVAPTYATSKYKSFSSATAGPKDLHVVASKASKKVKDEVGITHGIHVTPIRAFSLSKDGTTPIASSSADFKVIGSSFVRAGTPIVIGTGGVIKALDQDAEAATMPEEVPTPTDTESLLLQDMQKSFDEPEVVTAEEEPEVVTAEEEDEVVTEEDEEPWYIEGQSETISGIFPKDLDEPAFIPSTGETTDVYENDAYDAFGPR